MSRNREEKITQAQKEHLILFMECHKAFCHNQLIGVEGRRKYKLLWQNLEAELNALGPANPVAKRQKAWTDLKNKIKKKVAQMKAYRTGTGGGPPCGIVLDDIEERVVNLISKEAVYGLSTTMPLDTAMPSTSRLPSGTTSSIAIPPTHGTPILPENDNTDVHLSDHIYTVCDTSDDEPMFDENTEADATLVLPAARSSTPVSVVLSAARSSTPVSGTSTHSATRRRTTTTQHAVDNFTNLGGELNEIVTDIRDQLRELVAGRTETNILLQELINVLKK